MKLPNVLDIFIRKTKDLTTVDTVVIFAYMFSRLLYLMYSKKLLTKQDIDYVMMDQ